MDASPTKRRALATLDVNANSPNKHARLNAAKATGQLNVYKGGSPSPSSKRALSLAEEGDENANPLQPAKRACLSAATSTAPSTAPSSPTPRRAAAAPAVTPVKAVAGTPTTTAASRAEDTEETEEEDVASTATPEQERQRSHSPETSAVFDNSQLDNSQLTTITEPDHPSPQQQEQQQQQTQEESPVAAAVTTSAPSSSQLSPSTQQQQQQPPQQQRSRALSSLTREEARQKAEILRLRLGLARYKVRTGQTDVPLERLQRRPLPSAPTSTTTRTTTQSSPAAPQSHSQQQRRPQQQQPSAATAFSSPISTANTTRQPLPAPRRLSREDGSSGSERQQHTTPRKALPSGRSTSQTPRQGGDYTPSASQESATSQQSRPRYGVVATPDREALQRLAASAALDASRRIEEAAEGGRRGSGS